MRYLYNLLLIIFFFPVLGASFYLIGTIFFGFPETAWPRHLGIFGIWLFMVVLFVAVYNRRTKWLHKVGIYKSWSTFKAYLMEGHFYPEVTNIQKEEFLKWAGLAEERSDDYRDKIEGLYHKINSEIAFEIKRKMYIKCLAWYATGLPVNDGLYELNKTE